MSLKQIWQWLESLGKGTDWLPPLTERAVDDEPPFDPEPEPQTLKPILLDDFDAVSERPKIERKRKPVMRSLKLVNKGQTRDGP